MADVKPVYLPTGRGRGQPQTNNTKTNPNGRGGGQGQREQAKQEQPPGKRPTNQAALLGHVTDATISSSKQQAAPSNQNAPRFPIQQPPLAVKQGPSVKLGPLPVRQVYPVGNHALQVKQIPSPVQQDAPPVWQARPPGGGPKGSASLKDGSNKFEVAAANHQQSARRHLQNIASDVVPCNDGSSSEDEDEEGSGDGGREGGANHRNSNVLSSMMSSFSSLTKSAAIDGGAELGRTQQFIMNTLSHSANVCLICIDNIKKTDPVWSCAGCYNMFHTPCIQMWVRDGVYQQTALSDEHFPKKQQPPWFCPNCRREYAQSEAPKRYMCFCGGMEDPVFDPWLVPHSCGQVCTKPLRPSCGHSCLLLCHPGPCPPCPQTVQRSCYCAKSRVQVRRCGASEWSCGQHCARQLQCGHHVCSQPCHPGECSVCSKTSRLSCACARSTETRPCATPYWQCGKVCSKALSCGHHNCELVCHGGECGPCPRSGARTCPCTKTKFELDCTEEAPTCLETCDKTLDCGNHPCTQRCHVGPCGTCREMTLKRCRCGKRDKLVQCYKDYQCDTKCPNIKDCGKHPCKRKCCDGQCPPCTQPCMKTLGCHQHKCPSTCHRGPCYPCTLTVTLSCSCGGTTLTVPCGASKQRKPPKCLLPCKKPPDCHHESRDPHRCHAGSCPPCRQMCSKPRSRCPHACPLQCHSAVVAPVRLPGNQSRVGPWEVKVTPQMSVFDLPCPPCQVLLPITCLGKHETMMMACSDAVSRSCSQPCGRLLACMNHSCQLDCHVIQGAPDSKRAGQTCQTCDARCSLRRPDGCSHRCMSACHPPYSPSSKCAPCLQGIRMRCHCLLVQLHVECDVWVKSDAQERARRQSCSGACPKLLPCGHHCESNCHPAPCPNPAECAKNVTVRCPCKRRKAVYACSEVQAGRAALSCDDACDVAKERVEQERQLEEKAKAEAESKRLAEELEEFERRRPGGAGRKRRPRRQTNEDNEQSALQRYAVYSIAPLLAVLLAVFIWYILNN